jgi:hypothetical protein
MTSFADFESGAKEGGSSEEDDEDQHEDDGDSEDYEIDDQSEDELEIDKIEEELEGESDQYGEEELEEQESQEDSSGGEEEEDNLKDAGEVEEGIEEEDNIEEVEEPESIFNRIAGLDDSMVGNLRFNNQALLEIINSMKNNPKKVRGKNYREIAAAMSALSRNNVFLDALSELSNVTEFVFCVHKVYCVKLNPNGSDKDESLLVEMIRSALRNFMRHVPNRQSMLLTLSIQFISVS